MNVDEIDTILLLQTRLPTDSGQKPILQQNCTQIDRDINRDKKFSSLKS